MDCAVVELCNFLVGVVAGGVLVVALRRVRSRQEVSGAAVMGILISEVELSMVKDKKGKLVLIGAITQLWEDFPKFQIEDILLYIYIYN